MAPSPRAPEFFSTVPLLAVAVLALNDHFLKAAFHNTLTGKLSDVAGCFFFPLFISALLAQVTRWPLERRMGAGVLATLAIFVPIKLSVAGAELVARAMGVLAVPAGLGMPHIVTDPTDLLALPMIGLAVLYARKANPCVASSN